MLGLIAMSYVLLPPAQSPAQSDNPTQDILLMACVFLVFQLMAQMLVCLRPRCVIRSSHYAISESIGGVPRPAGRRSDDHLRFPGARRRRCRLRW
ncbi:MAG: hypothetical protein MZV70_56895 [Desulfobacterales bacterium]|nr:hypothetical protein [Desulfobacterales bacterium]